MIWLVVAVKEETIDVGQNSIGDDSTAWDICAESISLMTIA